MDAKGNIEKVLTSALSRLGISVVGGRLISYADTLEHGDFSNSIALTVAAAREKTPHQIAEEIVKAIGNIEGVGKIEIAGPGFINFHLSRDFFTESVKEVFESKEWGWGTALAGKEVMYEYTDPNPFKIFHIGHLMSNAIGESLARLGQSQGATVFRANYQGDIGPHVAKCLWGVMKEHLDAGNVKELGVAYAIGSAAYEDDPKAKEEIDSINKRLYANDPELKALYDAGRKASLERFEELYSMLGTKFDYYFFESEVAPAGVALVTEALARGIFEESDGAIVYKGEKKGLHTRVFLTKAGTPTYETKELGLNKEKFEKEDLDHSLIMTGTEQAGYFTVVLAAMADVLPDVAAKTEHVYHGLMQLVGGKMSSRQGNVITGESLIEDMRQKALEKMVERDLGDEKQKIADAVAVAAIKYSILKQATGKNIVFEPEQSLSFEGDSGPYLQYSYVRAQAVLRKAEAEGVNYTINRIVSPESVTELERLLYRFPEIVLRAQKENEPHHVTTFLTELASAFNSWYAQGKIVDSDATSPYKVALTEAFATTMKNGLWLLGIQAPERM